jgi:DNA polymerase-3 subunit epsilon
VQVLYRQFSEDVIETAVKRILRMPSLLPQLPPDTLERVPETPGVYFFFGDNPLPLYVGKSVNLRERIGAHFAGDWRSETDLRLSQEIRRVEFEETAGEFGALLREALLVKSMLPAHNRALRRKEEAGVLLLDDGVPRFVAASGIEPAALASRFGPFATRRAAREALRTLAAEHALCWRRLGLDQRTEGPCFQRQLKRCAGACVGAEDSAIHDARLRLALAPFAIPSWPARGEACLREHDPVRERTDVHVLRDWCWLGTARDDGELAELAHMRAQPVFDIDIARMLLKRHHAGTLALLPVPATARATAVD